jgi:hypothetical protein
VERPETTEGQTQPVRQQLKSFALVLNLIMKGFPFEETDQVQGSYRFLPVWPKATQIQERAGKKVIEDSS